MADEPIDFDAWLKEIQGTPAPETHSQAFIGDQPVPAEPADESDIDALFDLPEVASTVEAPVQPEAREFFESVKDDPDLAAAAATPAQAWEPEPTPFDNEPERAKVPTGFYSVQQEADRDQGLATLQADIRTVGERVTTLWELTNELAGLIVMQINELRTFRHDFDQAMAEDDEEIPAPKLLPEWAPPAPSNGQDLQPTGLGTTKRQRRGRKAS